MRWFPVGSYTETLEDASRTSASLRRHRPGDLEMLSRVAGSGVPMTVLPEHLGEFTG